jgi:hypothetical protein
MVSSALSPMPESEQTTSVPHKDLKIRKRIDRVLEIGCPVVAFLTPLKLSLTYCALIPLLLLYGYSLLREGFGKVRLSASLQTLLAPLGFFLLAVCISAATGISPLHSFNPVLSLVFFSFSIPLFATASQTTPVLLALVSGQTLAALHSVLDGALPDTLPPFFLGKVTESGQLAISIFIAIGLLWRTRSFATTSTSTKRVFTALTTLGCLTTIAVSTLAFRHDTGPLATPILFIAPCWAAVVAWLSSRLAGRDKAATLYAWLITLVFPLLTGALLVNLKRGPWFGVLTGVALLCAFFARKFLIAVVATATIAVAAFPAIQNRLSDSYTDFTITGGRSTIWQIGADLCTQFPMGVGYRNSGILRSFSHEIPEELDHFHNNLLNITAENGWLATVLFVWFIFTALRLCFSKPKEPLLVAIGCAIISWQLAGIVEYNAGDAEVLIMIWLLLGVAMKLLSEEGTSRPNTTPSTASLSIPS